MANLSIIVPIYNSVAFGLEKCIKSILKQSYCDFELILVNDGSTDDSLVICQRYEANDNRIRVIDQANGGVSRARNYGLEVAQGEFASFIDSDDIIPQDYFQSMMALAADTDLVVCGIRIIINNKEEKRYQAPMGEHNMDCAEDFHALIKSRLVAGPCNKIFKRNIIKDNNIVFPEDSDFGEDRVFCYEYLKHIKLYTGCQDVYYDYVMQNDNSLTRKAKPDYFEKEVTLWRKQLELYKYFGYVEGDIRKDLYAELYWWISDNSFWTVEYTDKSYKEFSRFLSLPEIDEIRLLSKNIIANPIEKFAIVNRMPRLLYCYHKLRNLCSKI